jgi:FtsH-binding integral membrane protein
MGLAMACAWVACALHITISALLDLGNQQPAWVFQWKHVLTSVGVMFVPLIIGIFAGAEVRDLMNQQREQDSDSPCRPSTNSTNSR